MDVSTPYITTRTAAQLLGISVVTLKRWETQGKIHSVVTTKQKHRMYQRAEIIALLTQRDSFTLHSGKHTFVFDFDSTLFPEETLDTIIYSVLKEQYSLKKANERMQSISAICQQGMNGNLPLYDSIMTRLTSVDIYRRHIEAYIKKSKQKFSTLMKKTIIKLREANQEVYVLSGAFQEWVVPLCKYIHIDNDHIFTNRLVFNTQQKVVDVFKSSPLLYNNGKAKVLQELQGANALPGNIIMIGDGSSDLEVKTQGIADWFIGCGIYIQRSIVKQHSDQWFTNESKFNNYIQNLL